MSASDLRKHERTPPLQDNLELAYGMLLRRLPPRAADALEWSLAHECASRRCSNAPTAAYRGLTDSAAQGLASRRSWLRS